MLKKAFFAILLLSLAGTAGSQHRPAYMLYNSEGKKVDYSFMTGMMNEADIVLFGEEHNNPISHWLQLELTRDLHRLKEGRIILAAEMFEADNQVILDEYLGGMITESYFESEMRLWNNYKTDQKPLVLFAKENGLPFVASNIPRRYANMVFHGGFEALEKLSSKAKEYIAPLPVEYCPDLSQYKKMVQIEGAPMDHGPGPNLPKAQAVKDATMAHFIMENFVPGKTVVHFHGTYHSDFYQGIMWYLQQGMPELRIRTIATVTGDMPGKLGDEHHGRADVIIKVPETMTRTY